MFKRLDLAALFPELDPQIWLAQGRLWDKCRARGIRNVLVDLL